ncbi:MAG: SDR family oxidoreductase [Planctomycetaceae bacterium]|nr:SDR family oxidoreductase [Planctomycetaceae bacterium]
MSESDFYTMKNPVDEYRTEGFPKQKQPYPGVQKKMDPVPDCGEKTYKGNNRLPGRKALITGGDSGIGRAAAIAYAREGADIAINYLPAEEDDAKELKELLEKEKRTVHLIPGDLADEEFNKQMVKQAHEKLGGLDNIAMVAGHQVATKSIEDIDTEQLHRVFAINVYSMFWTVKAALPLLPPGSAIITTSSIQAYDPSKHLLDYASTKGAIKAFTQALGEQLIKKGIRVNSVAPGPIWTALQVSGGQFQEALPKFGQDTPFKRAGQPVELSGLYVFLASQESSYITSEVYGVTGGSHL